MNKNIIVLVLSMDEYISFHVAIAHEFLYCRFSEIYIREATIKKLMINCPLKEINIVIKLRD